MPETKSHPTSETHKLDLVDKAGEELPGIATNLLPAVKPEDFFKTHLAAASDWKTRTGNRKDFGVV